MKKFLYSLFIIDILFALILIGFVFYAKSHIAAEKTLHQALAATLNENNCKTASPEAAISDNNLAAEPITEDYRAINMLIESGTISPYSLPAYKGKPLSITITNNESGARRLMIEKINYDSGIINSGEIREITIENIPQEPGTYEFKVSANDEQNTIIGTLIVF
jgi:hypothetical protein